MTTGLFFLAVMLLGVPIGVCLCLAGIVYIFATDATVLLQSFPSQMFGGVDSYGLIAIPLFILMGNFATQGGISKALFEVAATVMARFKGGLARSRIRRIRLTRRREGLPLASSPCR